ncbi:MAG: hydrolase 2, exosortase A system-associated [Burkholderiales bacterium]|nr:hydrolase 2, exosortase A system-associated [Burkholderiales bacterium]
MGMKALFRDGAPAHGGRRLVVMHEPAGTPRGVVVGVAGFAEEMNKGRRTAAMGARALAREGFLVVQPDLAGCGDSSGDLVDASWSAWVADVLDTAHWAAGLVDADLPLTLWGVRAGCLVAAQAKAQLQRPANLLFWQPQPNGKLVLQQFLRLKMAGQLQQGPAKGVTEGLLADLAAGRAVEVAGYPLGAGVAHGLGAAQLVAPDTATRVLWLEVSAQTPPELLPASHNVVQRWTAAGIDVHAEAVTGPLFWQSQDIEEAPALVERSAEKMRTLCEAAATA